MDAIIVRTIDLPTTVKGMTVLDEEGDYNIYLNARLSGDLQAVAFRHEIEHIRRGDFYSAESVGEKERRIGF